MNSTYDGQQIHFTARLDGPTHGSPVFYWTGKRAFFPGSVGRLLVCSGS